MKKALLGLVVPMLVGLSGPILAQTDFVANLTADQVVGGTSSTASGTATLTLNAARDTLTYSITLVGLDLDGMRTPEDTSDDVTGLHFHAAPPGVNGGVVFGLIAPNHDTDDRMIDATLGTVEGIWEEGDTFALSGQLANLEAGGLYLNVHTQAFPGGEIRGQVEPLVFSDGFESGDVLAWSSSVP